MAERTFTAEEVNAALKLAGVGQRSWFESGTESDLRCWWDDPEDDLSWNVALLALGVLPEGWEWDSPCQQYHHNEVTIRAPWAGAAGFVMPYDPPSAVRSGQYEIAGRLIAAHVELERLRARKGGG